MNTTDKKALIKTTSKNIRHAISEKAKQAAKIDSLGAVLNEYNQQKSDLAKSGDYLDVKSITDEMIVERQIVRARIQLDAENDRLRDCCAAVRGVCTELGKPTEAMFRDVFIALRKNIIDSVRPHAQSDWHAEEFADSNSEVIKFDSFLKRNSRNNWSEDEAVLILDAIEQDGKPWLVVECSPV